MRPARKKPEVLDLNIPSHRVTALRAYHALLSQGKDETEAKAGAVAYALEHWDELRND